MRKAISVRLPYALLEDCRAFARSNGMGLTDMIIAGLVNQLKTAKSEPCNTIAGPVKSPVASSCRADIAVNKPVYDKVFFNPQPKAIKDRPARNVPPATRPPNKPTLSLDAIRQAINTANSLESPTK